MDCLERTKILSAAAGWRGDVNRLQRTHVLGLADTGKRAEPDRLQRIVPANGKVFHCRIHQSISSFLSSVITGAHSAPFPFRRINARFLTRFNFRAAGRRTTRKSLSSAQLGESARGVPGERRPTGGRTRLGVPFDIRRRDNSPPHGGSFNRTAGKIQSTRKTRRSGVASG